MGFEAEGTFGVESGGAFAFDANASVVVPLLPPARLSSLGPVLLVRATRRRPGTWQLSVGIDEQGVRECLSFAAWRVYRLPDSDYLGWETLTSCVPWSVSRVPLPGRIRRASVACAESGSWRSVARLSALGWKLVDDLLRYETATLCAAVWER